MSISTTANEWRRTDNDGYALDVEVPFFSPVARLVLQVLRQPHLIAVEIFLWLFIAVAFPLPPKGLKFSLDSDLPEQLAINFDDGRETPVSNGSKQPGCPMALSGRVLLRLEQAEERERNPHFRDDIRIAWITVFHASRGAAEPFVIATYTVLGMHPDRVWESMVYRRHALLGSEYDKFYGASSPRKPPQSVRPNKKEEQA